MKVRLDELVPCLFCGAVFAGTLYAADHEPRCPQRPAVVLQERRQPVPLLGVV